MTSGYNYLTLHSIVLLARAATSIIFVATKDVFCRDKHKHGFCRDKTFVATKMILVAAPANDTIGPLYSGNLYLNK